MHALTYQVLIFFDFSSW